jgi:hypothetical protein
MLLEVARETRISGNWTLAIQRDKNEVMTAAARFLRAALPNSTVTVNDVAAGSLIISYKVVSAVKATELDALVAAAPLQTLQSSYQTLTGSMDQLQHLETSGGPSAKGTPAPSGGSSTGICSTSCLYAVMGAIALVVVVVGFFVCRNRKQDARSVASGSSYSGKTSAPAPSVMRRELDEIPRAASTSNHLRDLQQPRGQVLLLPAQIDDDSL